jgi:hypothetical protein
MHRTAWRTEEPEPPDRLTVLPTFCKNAIFRNPLPNRGEFKTVSGVCAEKMWSSAGFNKSPDLDEDKLIPRNPMAGDRGRGGDSTDAVSRRGRMGAAMPGMRGGDAGDERRRGWVWGEGAAAAVAWRGSSNLAKRSHCRISDAIHPPSHGR